MPETVLYIASSVDGYIAAPDGSVAWLDAFQDTDYGYEAFYASIETVVMGRTTYEQVREFPVPWPYADRRSVIVSRSLPIGPVADLPNVTVKTGDDLPALVKRLMENATGDLWLVGGTETLRGFLAANLVDRYIITVLPILLGDGIRLFPPLTTQETRLALESAKPFTNGAVVFDYHRLHSEEK